MAHFDEVRENKGARHTDQKGPGSDSPRKGDSRGMPRLDKPAGRKNVEGTQPATHPRNAKTMGGAERLSEQDAHKVSRDSRAEVNSNNMEKHDPAENTARSHMHLMESHQRFMESKRGMPAQHGGGLNQGMDTPNTQTTANPLQSVPMP